MALTRRQLLARSTTLLVLPLLACAEGETGEPVGTRPQPSPTPSSEPSPTAGTGMIAHPTGANDLVLRIDRTGGLLPPFRGLVELPLFAMYGDGSVVTQGPQIAIYPPPALPNLLVTVLTEEGLQALLREAAAAGLLEGDQQYDFPVIPDGTTTIFTVHAGGRSSVVTTYALLEVQEDDPRLPVREREPRRRLRAFLLKALDFSSWLPPAAIAIPEQFYRIERLQLLVVRAEQVSDESIDVQPTELDWPLAAPLATFGSPYEVFQGEGRCGVVEREELALLLDSMIRANTLTRWRSDGHLYHVFPRPLLPDESGCLAR